MAKTPKAKASLRVVDAVDTAEKLFLKGHSEIPPCSVPLCQAAQEFYDNYCRVLLKRGVLTLQNREAVERYAIGKDMIVRAYAAGKTPPRNGTEMMRNAEMALRKLDLNEAINPPAAKCANPFAGFGFARRARQGRVDRD